MRDIHRLKERFELSLDNRQVLLLAFGAFAVVAAAFGLGVAAGDKLATARPRAAPKDLLAIVDQQTAGLEGVQRPAALTFQEELTRKLPASPPAPAPGTAPLPRPGEGPRQAEPTAPAQGLQAAAPQDRAPLDPAPADRASADRAPTAPAASPAAPLPSQPQSPGGDPPTLHAVAGATGAPQGVSPVAAAAGAAAPTVGAAGAPAAPAAAAGGPAVDRDVARTPGSLRDAFLRAQRPPPAAASAAGASPPSTAWTVQVSASQERVEAERVAAELRAKGYAPYIVSAELPGKGVWHRVRMGRFGSKEAASRYLVDFKRETQLGAFVASAGAP